MTRKSKPILLVDDDDVDTMIVERALEALEVPNQLICMPDGQAAFEYLTDENNEKPGVLFLDLNMPRMDGWELLEHIIADNKLRKIPVVILTTSDNPDDINKAGRFKPPIVSYITKPADYKETVEVFREQLVALNIIESKHSAV